MAFQPVNLELLCGSDRFNCKIYFNENRQEIFDIIMEDYLNNIKSGSSTCQKYSIDNVIVEIGRIAHKKIASGYKYIK
jgi:hypothetical protein